MRMLLVAIALSGCAAMDYSRTSSMELCKDYLALPSFNVYQGQRAAELSRRGENCQAYYGAAAAQQQADQRFYDIARGLHRPAPQPIRCYTDRLGYTTCY